MDLYWRHLFYAFVKYVLTLKQGMKCLEIYNLLALKEASSVQQEQIIGS